MIASAAHRPPPRSRDAWPMVLFSFASAAAAAALLISLFIGAQSIAFSILGVIILGLLFSLSGNQRLFCLWGLVLTAPLRASKAFMVSAHMGGAAAITIDLCDIFLFPLLLFIARDYVTGRNRALRFSPILFWWGALTLLGVGDVIIGPLRQLAALEVVRMVKCYLLFFAIVNEVARLRQFAQLIGMLIAEVMVESLFAIAQFTFKANFGLQFLGEPPPESIESASKSVYLGAGDVYRAGGLFSHANMLAGYLAMVLPILLALLFARLPGRIKLIIGVIIVLGLGALVITLSRSGWTSFGTAFILLMSVMFFHPFFRRRQKKMKMIVVVCAAVGLALASGAIIKRITQSDPGAVDFRLDMMDTAWAMVRDYPVFGTGLNSFVADMPPYSKYHGPKGVTEFYGKVWPVVHNSYLITWSQQGTVGFFFLMGTYFCVLRTGVRTSRIYANDTLSLVNIGATCGIVAIMIDGFASFFIDEAMSARVFWMIVGTIFAIHYWTEANAPLLRARKNAATLAAAPPRATVIAA